MPVALCRFDYAACAAKEDLLERSNCSVSVSPAGRKETQSWVLKPPDDTQLRADSGRASAPRRSSEPRADIRAARRNSEPRVSTRSLEFLHLSSPGAGLLCRGGWSVGRYSFLVRLLITSYSLPTHCLYTASNSY